MAPRVPQVAPREPQERPNMAPRDLRETNSKAIVALRASTLPGSRQLAWRSFSGWAGGETRNVK
eukprot:4982229-Pyramimonas_sp.AAC.1